MIIRLTFISTGRSDFSSLSATIQACIKSQRFKIRLLTCDEETSKEALSIFGTSIKVLAIGRLPKDDSPLESCRRLSSLLSSFASDLDEHRPDAIVAVGDRYELLAVMAAAVPLRVPLCHISGGELTFGAIDEQVRHAMTKVAHIHCVANESFARRLCRMGEEEWRIHVTGDPGIDRIAAETIATVDDVSRHLGSEVNGRTIVVAHHPVTARPSDTWNEWSAITQALDNHDGLVVVTGPNADPQGLELSQRQRSWCANHEKRLFAPNLGSYYFLGLLKACGCLLGNSSSGLWEAPSLCTPAINIGHRQDGRLRGDNVIDVSDPTPLHLLHAIDLALGTTFRKTLSAKNPYGDGNAAPRIAEVLSRLPLSGESLRKRFHDHV